MGGRDPHEKNRVATPLELLFDLTFATCFSFAASQFAAELAEGRYAAALLGFGFASITICWAWGSFSWFSSAYDTDDWLFRLATMVQMIGVLVLAIGLPPMFASIERGQTGFGAPPRVPHLRHYNLDRANRLGRADSRSLVNSGCPHPRRHSRAH